MGEKQNDREPAAFEQDGRPRNLDEIRTQEMRADPGHESAGATAPLSDGVLVQVCEVCGMHYTFDEQEPPADMKCGRCGNGVFRSFFDVAAVDEVEADYREATDRDLSTDAPATDVTAADVRDLDNI